MKVTKRKLKEVLYARLCPDKIKINNKNNRENTGTLIEYYYSCCGINETLKFLKILDEKTTTTSSLLEYWGYFFTFASQHFFDDSDDEYFNPNEKKAIIDAINKYYRKLNFTVYNFNVKFYYYIEDLTIEDCTKVMKHFDDFKPNSFWRSFYLRVRKIINLCEKNQLEAIMEEKYSHRFLVNNKSTNYAKNFDDKSYEWSEKTGVLHFDKFKSIECAKKWIKFNPNKLDWLPEEFFTRDFLTFCAHEGEFQLFRHLPQKYKSEHEFLLSLLKINIHIFEFMKEEYLAPLVDYIDSIFMSLEKHEQIRLIHLVNQENVQSILPHFYITELDLEKLLTKFPSLKLFIIHNECKNIVHLLKFDSDFFIQYALDNCNVNFMKSIPKESFREKWSTKFFKLYPRDVIEYYMEENWEIPKELLLEFMQGSPVSKFNILNPILNESLVEYLISNNIDMLTRCRKGATIIADSPKLIELNCIKFGSLETLQELPIRALYNFANLSKIFEHVKTNEDLFEIMQSLKMRYEGYGYGGDKDIFFKHLGIIIYQIIERACIRVELDSQSIYLFINFWCANNIFFLIIYS